MSNLYASVFIYKLYLEEQKDKRLLIKSIMGFILTQREHYFEVYITLIGTYHMGVDFGIRGSTKAAKPALF